MTKRMPGKVPTTLAVAATLSVSLTPGATFEKDIETK